jgi:betaine lipid synthase
MASAGGNILPPDIGSNYLYAGIAGVTLFAVGLSKLYSKPRQDNDGNPGLIKAFFLFCYSCFIKPHSDAENASQQAHLESFYAAQSGVYDRTRRTLLKGREDMLALVAAQLRFKADANGSGDEGKKRIWVDVSLWFSPIGA